MKYRSLAFHQIPVRGGRLRAEDLCSSRYEIRDDGVDGNTAAGDEDAGLSSSAEVSVQPAFAELPLQAQCGVFLAQRAICAHGQQPLAGSLGAGSDRNV